MKQEELRNRRDKGSAGVPDRHMIIGMHNFAFSSGMAVAECWLKNGNEHPKQILSAVDAD